MSGLFLQRERRALRRSVRVECQVVRERDWKLVARRGIDLSDRGMLVLSDLPVLTGEELVVSLRAPLTRLWFDCSATVARVVHGRRPGDWGQCLGIAFDSLDEVSRTLIRSELRGLPPPVPARRARLDHVAAVRALSGLLPSPGVGVG